MPRTWNLDNDSNGSYMKKFRFTIAMMSLAAICCMVSCEKQKTEEEKKKEDEEIVVDPEKYPYNENTWVVDGIENDIFSTALTMVGENLAIAASTDEGLTDVTAIMESEEFFYAAVSPVLLNKEFNPKTEKSVFTLISTLSDVPLETVAPDETDEIKDGKCLMTFEDNILTLKAELILADETKVGLHITAKAKEGEEIVINENIIGRGDEVKPLRSSFYKEEEGQTYLFFTPANISYFSELDIERWYMYLVIPSDKVTTKGAEAVRFGVVDNVDSANSFELDADAIAEAAGTCYVATSGEGRYTADISFDIADVTYFVKFDGTCISADVEEPVEVLETYFKYNGEELTIESAVLVKKDDVWTLNLAVSNGRMASVTMSPDFFAKGGTFGFSQDKNLAVGYAGKTYSKANGDSGTVTMHLDESSGIVETQFTNYKDLEFYYKGKYTEEGYHIPFTLKVYDITSVSATVEVEPYDTDAPYYMDIITATDFAQAQKYGFDDYMTYLLETMEANTGKGRQEVIEMISSYGNDGFILTSLTPETEYVAVAVGLSETGMTCTEVVYETFATLEPVVSANAIEVSASDITATAATINVTTSNEDPYVLAIEPSNCIYGLTGEELADYIIQSNIAWGGLAQMTYTGNQQIEYEGKSGWKYSVIAFGYEDGAVTSDVTVYEMTMGEGGDPSACTFDFGFEVEEWEMYLDVTPSVNDVVYICNIVKKSDLDVLTDVSGSEQGALAECLETLIEDMIADCGSRERVVDLISIMGNQSFNIKYTYETEYVQWAVPVDQNGNPTGPFSVSEVFKTPAEAKSDASLSLVSYRVFDGTELAALDPSRFKNAKGYAVVELIVEPSETADKWWSYIALDDLTDRTEQVIIKNILQAPTQEGATKQYIVSFWGTNTIMGVAQDAEGKYGPLLLEVIHLDQNNVTPGTAL